MELTARALAPLDQLRRAAWKLSAKTRLGRACLRDRAYRLTTYAVLHVTLTSALLWWQPTWLLFLGPIVLGLPHLASDLRYLVLDGPAALTRRHALWLLVPLIGMSLWRALSPTGGLPGLRVELGLGFIGIALAILWVRGPWPRKWLALFCLSPLLLLAWPRPYAALLWVAHAHNGIALLFWLYFFKRTGSWRQVGLIVAAYLVPIAAIALGAFDMAVYQSALQHRVGMFSMGGMAESLAPGLPPPWALRVVAIFAYAQAFHYVIWLRLLPQTLDRRPNPPTFRRTASRIRRDFGRIGAPLLVALCLAFPIAALLLEPARVHHLYLLGALGHGWLEFAIIFALWVGPVRHGA